MLSKGLTDQNASEPENPRHRMAGECVSPPDAKGKPSPEASPFTFFAKLVMPLTAQAVWRVGLEPGA